MTSRLIRSVWAEFTCSATPWRQGAAGSQLFSPLRGLSLDGAGLSEASDGEGQGAFGPLWFAVPKKRVPVGKKRTRTADRAPKRITHYSMCEKCGQPKLHHKFCENIELCAGDGTSKVATER